MMQHLECDMRGEATYDTAVASGYILGIADAMAGLIVCMPATTTVKQTKQVLKQVLRVCFRSKRSKR